MKKIHFPPVDEADENGIVHVGGELTVENLLAAYSQGIFPWPHARLPLLWFSPDPRGVLRFSQFHIPRSTQKELRQKKFTVTFDQNFLGVIQGCADHKRGQHGGTWITPEMVAVYQQMFAQGFAHSVECWQGSELVGGLYGVYVQGVFSGESMFFLDSGASKQCLISVVEKLTQLGHEWMDIQMVTPVLESFGGSYVARTDYLQMLKDLQSKNILWSGK